MQALPALLRLVDVVGRVQAACANLACQLGALSAASTRKATILQVRMHESPCKSFIHGSCKAQMENTQCPIMFAAFM